MMIVGISIFVVALLLAIFSSFIRPKLGSRYDGHYTYEDIPYHHKYHEVKADKMPFETIEDRAELSEAYSTLGVRPDDPTGLVKEMDIPEGGQTPQGKIRLFHGTTPERACEILKNGFAPEKSIQGHYGEGGKYEQCIWLTTDIGSARGYGRGAIVEVEAWPNDLDKMACQAGMGSNKGWDDVHCCKWNDKLVVTTVYLIMGKNEYGKVKLAKLGEPCTLKKGN